MCENNFPYNQLLGGKRCQNMIWFQNILNNKSKIFSPHKTLLGKTFPSNALSDIESQNRCLCRTIHFLFQGETSIRVCKTFIALSMTLFTDKDISQMLSECLPSNLKNGGDFSIGAVYVGNNPKELTLKFSSVFCGNINRPTVVICSGGM